MKRVVTLIVLSMFVAGCPGGDNKSTSQKVAAITQPPPATEPVEETKTGVSEVPIGPVVCLDGLHHHEPTQRCYRDRVALSEIDEDPGENEYRPASHPHNVDTVHPANYPHDATFPYYVQEWRRIDPEWTNKK